MKPKEFDELVRHKFDQNDFEYNPRNWEKLEEALDGRSKKHKMLMWWWIPLTGIAASVALALGVSGILSQPGNVPNAGSTVVKSATISTGENNILMLANNSNQRDASVAQTRSSYTHALKILNKNIHTAKKKNNSGEDFIAIVYQNAVGNIPAKNLKHFQFMTKEAIPTKEKKKPTPVIQIVSTFKPDEEIKAPKTSIILSGGISHGTSNSGYMAGATIRRMVSDKVYIESDVAFTSSNNTQSMTVPTGTILVPASTAAKAARITSPDGKPVTVPKSHLVETFGAENVSYNLYYAQVTPSLGYQVMKKMSIGVGPDFQQMLADNRPVASADVRNNIKTVPVFDIGFVGKTEYSLTKKIKAAVSYRKGVNNVITPMDKYIDRDYLQFQVRCAILNR